MYRLDIAVVYRDAPDYFCPTAGLDQDHFALVGQLPEVAEAATESMTGELLDRIRGFRCALIAQQVTGERRFQAELPQGSAQQDRET
ncbi:MAG: hypothetical protein AMJ93_11215 [Anaerolineae bacterium SM23_84]|nr:MAG: hypothetical protein AMJ93_11215 [Anaerolineae bacterium SM23_84]